MKPTLKAHFPVLTNNPDLTFLDSASSTQKPQFVIDAVSQFMERDYANVHRGAYTLSQRSELMIDETRSRAARRLGAHTDELIFTSNSTDASNRLIASFIASGWITDGSTVYLCTSDHHASIVPRQIVQSTMQHQGATLHLKRYDIDAYSKELFTDATIVMAPHISNVLGVVNDIQTLKTHLPDTALLCVDGSQSLPHIQCDMQALGCDFFWATGHKLGAYPGVGLLWGKRDHLKRLTPGIGGGGAVETVTMDGHLLQPAPDKFEPGTPNLSAIRSLGAALERAEQVGGSGSGIEGWYATLHALDKKLLQRASARIERLNSLGIECTHLGGGGTGGIGARKIGLIALQFAAGTPMQSLSMHLAKHAVAVRVGGLCAQPLHSQLKNRPSLRLSTRIYSTPDDIDTAFDCIEEYFQ